MISFPTRRRAALMLAGVLAIAVSPSPAVSGTVILHDVRLIDGTGATPRQHMDIVIDGERITAIRSARTYRSRDMAVTIVDLSGKTVLPGLISDHSHLGLVDGTKAGGENATPTNILRQLRQYEAYGVTTVMSLGLNQQSFYDLAPKVHAGEFAGADMFGADRGFGEPDGAPPAGMGILDTQVYRPRTPDEARVQVRETAARHPTLMKIWVDDFHGAMPAKLPPEVYKAIIDEAHAQGIRVAAHVYYLDDAKRLVADGVDVLAHGVRDKRVDADFINAMKARGVWYVPTLGLDESFYLFAEHPELVNDPVIAHALQPELARQFADPAWRAKVLGDTKKLATDKASVAVNLENVKILHDAGVRIGFGTDSGATPLRIAGFAEHHELALLVRAGLTPLQAITTATRNAAALLGLEDRGTLEPGKLADILVVEGDPSARIADVDRIVAVWHRGKSAAGTLDSYTP
jgi:imidazolonepropionase-like amidohydrolase